MEQKVMQVTKERGDSKRLGGERRGAANKVPLVAAVPLDEGGRPIAVNVAVAKGFRQAEMARRATRQCGHFRRIALFFGRDTGRVQPYQHGHGWVARTVPPKRGLLGSTRWQAM
jgi:hypothetical protein